LDWLAYLLGGLAKLSFGSAGYKEVFMAKLNNVDIDKIKAFSVPEISLSWKK